MHAPSPSAGPTRETTPLAPIIERNVRALIARREDEQRNRTFHDKLSDRITAFAGSMVFVYFHAVLFGSWILVNLGWTPLPRFDPSFVVLAMVASVEAIFLSTFVLISQNRMAALHARRADLDLQFSLLAEHEITHLVQLVDAMAAKMGIEHADPEALESLKREVAPEAVLDEIEGRGRRRRHRRRAP